MVFFFATVSLIYNALLDEEYSTGVRALGVAGAIATFVIGVVLWRRASQRKREELPRI